MKYNAFISYSHSEDAALAPALEKALETFAKPTFKRRALHIFRDGNDLSVSPDLWGKIENGLSDTGHFIFLASPASAKSHYCGKEVDYWLEHKSIDTFLLALTEGEIHWDHEANDFDWEKTTAIPKQLSGVFKNEPLYVDFRSVKASNTLSLDNPEFKTNAVLFAATLHDKSVGDMVGEDVKQHKRTVRLRNGAIGVLSALLIAAIALSIYAINQRNTAVLEGNKAKLVSFIANSQGQFSEDPTKALRLAEHGYAFAKANNLPTTDATEQLIKVFYSGQGFYQASSNRKLDTEVKNVVSIRGTRILNPNDGTYAVENKMKNDDQYSTSYSEVDPNGRIIYTYTFQYPKSNPRFSEGGNYFLVDEIDGLAITTEVYQRRSNKLLAKVTGDDEYLPPVIATKDEMVLLAGGEFKLPKLYLNNQWQYPEEISLDGFSGYNDGIGYAAISGNKQFSAVGAYKGRAAIIDNELFRMMYARDRFKVRALLKSADQQSIDGIQFVDQDRYLLTYSKAYRKVGEDKFEEDVIPHLWKTKPFTYIELQQNIKGDHYLIENTGEINGMASAVPEALSKNGAGIVARFPECPGGSSDRMSNDGRYMANTEGVYTADGELLITLDLFTSDNLFVYGCFSEDSKYYKVSYEQGLRRIFLLDPDEIIYRINSPQELGPLAQLSEEDKARFLVEPIDRASKAANKVNISHTSQEALGTNETEEPKLRKARITVDNLRVRTTPDLNGETLTNLAINSQVRLIGERSQNPIAVTINGEAIEEYWYKIQTTEGIEGWIHGCCFEE